ncbi:hypothetical protein [uncultured Mycolicibacterium sp.]|uniref:hypothetical protein n=1 Tax=uncultured Mycolicibacterium sp. TaxID=2320817 RepID=UPI0026067647|nr:hypothetical protein [uncultured Mycolicibacterium sp.]
MTAADTDRRYGELPLAQTTAAAGPLRRLAGLLLTLEHPHPAVDELVATLGDYERRLAAAAPADPTPRPAGGPADQRVYLQHAFDVGGYNPCFPEYRMTRLDAASAAGTVTFPLVYEGPPGLVHGGFLGVFVDCVAQHHSCAAGRAGRTRSMTVRYWRPVPILTELCFDIERATHDRGITSTVRLTRAGELLCTGEVESVGLPPERLSASDFGRRGETGPGRGGGIR